MAEYKLAKALPGVHPGNTETHYGRVCQVRADGIYVDLDHETARVWVGVGRVHGPLRYERPEAPKIETPKSEEAPNIEVPKVEEVPKAPEVPFERVIVEPPKAEVPQTMTQVMEEGSGKRGRPVKAK